MKTLSDLHQTDKTETIGPPYPDAKVDKSKGKEAKYTFFSSIDGLLKNNAYICTHV